MKLNNNYMPQSEWLYVPVKVKYDLALYSGLQQMQCTLQQVYYFIDSLRNYNHLGQVRINIFCFFWSLFQIGINCQEAKQIV